MLRNIHFGKFFVDTTTCLDFGLPPSAWACADAMSDLLSALVLNPFVLIADTSTPAIPFTLKKKGGSPLGKTRQGCTKAHGMKPEIATSEFRIHGTKFMETISF